MTTSCPEPAWYVGGRYAVRKTAVDFVPRAQGSSSADAVTIDDSHTPNFPFDVRGAEITSLVDRPQKSCEV